MGKWIGQHIFDLVARLRSDVYLDDISTGTIASGSNLGLDSNNKIVKAALTSHDAVTLAGTPDYITISGQEITRNAIDLTADVTGTLPVANGGTGASSLTDNAILLGNSTSAIEASSHLSYHTPGTNQDFLKIGDSSTTTAGITSDNSAQLNITVEGSTGTNAAGNDITFLAGLSTGNAAGGDFIFRSSPSGSSGSSVNIGTEVAKIDNVGNLQIDGGLTVGSTSFVNNSGVIQVANQSNITGVGTISSGTWQGTAIASAYIADDAVTFAKASGVTPNIFGNVIKVLPSDFVTNDDGGVTKFGIGYVDSSGTSYGMKPTNANTELYAFVSIPEGMTATHVDIYAKQNRDIEVFEIQINANTMVSKGTGTSNTTLDITDVAATSTNLLALKITTTATSDRVFGAAVTIA